MDFESGMPSRHHQGTSAVGNLVDLGINESSATSRSYNSRMEPPRRRSISRHRRDHVTGNTNNATMVDLMTFSDNSSDEPFEFRPSRADIPDSSSSQQRRGRSNRREAADMSGGQGARARSKSNSSRTTTKKKGSIVDKILGKKQSAPSSLYLGAGGPFTNAGSGGVSFIDERQQSYSAISPTTTTTTSDDDCSIPDLMTFHPNSYSTSSPFAHNKTGVVSRDNFNLLIEAKTKRDNDNVVGSSFPAPPPRRKSAMAMTSSSSKETAEAIEALTAVAKSEAAKSTRSKTGVRSRSKSSYVDRYLQDDPPMAASASLSQSQHRSRRDSFSNSGSNLQRQESMNNLSNIQDEISALIGKNAPPPPPPPSTTRRRSVSNAMQITTGYDRQSAQDDSLLSISRASYEALASSMLSEPPPR